MVFVARARSLITGVNAQSAAAKVHVDAARAAVAPSVRIRTGHATRSRRCSIRPGTEPKLPDTMRTNDRSAVVPRKEWFTFPVEIFDNLHFVGTKTAGYGPSVPRKASSSLTPTSPVRSWCSG